MKESEVKKFVEKTNDHQLALAMMVDYKNEKIVFYHDMSEFNLLAAAKLILEQVPIEDVLQFLKNETNDIFKKSQVNSGDSDKN